MMDQGITYQSGSGAFFVYTSEFAGTNKATAMMFELPGDAFDAAVADLRSKGVTFQTFDAEGMEWDDGVASMGGRRRLQERLVHGPRRQHPQPRLRHGLTERVGSTLWSSRPRRT